jgi:protein involved in polysaccharide export with SLBB domain
MKILAVLFVIASGAFALAQDALLRPGDQVEIRLGGVPPEEISQVSALYTIDGQGFVNMPHIGKIKAANVTQSDLQNAIEGAYRSQQIYTNPTITINVGNQARFVNVGGDVKAPQRVSYTADMTLQSAIMACGGFTEYADQKKVQLMQDGKQTLHNFHEIRKNPSKDVPLKPGDNIWVPQSFW